MAELNGVQELKRGAKVCPCDGGTLFFEQFSGMSLYKEVVPEKPKRPYYVYSAQCSKCFAIFNVKK